VIFKQCRVQNRAKEEAGEGKSFNDGEVARTTVIPYDAEFARALADLLADKGRIENAGEFLLAHARSRFTFVWHVIICAVLQNRILVSRRCIVRSILPTAKSEK